MWILGHTALSYLILRPVFKLEHKEPEGYQLFYIFLFANILDTPVI